MVYFDLLHPLGIDFPQFYEATKMIFSNQNPYHNLLTSPGPWNYPPTAFLFLFWLNFFPYDLASVIWNLSSLIAFIVVFLLLAKMAKLKNRFLYLVIILLTFFPLKHNLASGQINNFLLLFIVLLAYSSKVPFVAYASIIKIIPSLFLFYFFIQKKYKAIVMFFVWVAAFVFLSFLVVPINFQWTYFTTVAPQAWSVAGKEIYYNQSLLAFLARSLKNPQIPYYLSVLLVVFLTWWRGGKISKNRQLAAVSLLLLILPPLVWQHHYVLATIPLVLLFRENTLAVIIAYALIASNIKNPGSISQEFGLTLSHQFFGAILLWLTALWKDKPLTLYGVIWAALLLSVYVFNLLCRARFCF